MTLKNTVLAVLLLLLAACGSLPRLDEVVTDRRTEYKRSESMPALEVPPDLTVNANADPLAIPNEEATTLSQFEQQKRMRQAGVGGAPVGASGEQWLSLQGNSIDIWPRLKEFWDSKGYALDLDDPELGVLETHWFELAQEGITSSRTKFSIFAESGATPDSTVLYLTSRRQEKIADKGEDADWVDISDNTELEKKMLGELNLYFYGKQAPAGTSGSAASNAPPVSTSTMRAAAAAKPRAELQNLGEDKVLLALPEDFNHAWTLTESAILNAGMFINNKDRSKGLYYVVYSGAELEGGEKKGFFSRLKFWGKDKSVEGTAYQISLTGVGNKTELVVLNAEGDWAEQEEAARILTLLQGQYNNVR